MDMKDSVLKFGKAMKEAYMPIITMTVKHLKAVGSFELSKFLTHSAGYHIHVMKVFDVPAYLDDLTKKLQEGDLDRNNIHILLIIGDNIDWLCTDKSMLTWSSDVVFHLNECGKYSCTKNVNAHLATDRDMSNGPYGILNAVKILTSKFEWPEGKRPSLGGHNETI